VLNVSAANYFDSYSRLRLENTVNLSEMLNFYDWAR
jgi:hypothetical protein